MERVTEENPTPEWRKEFSEWIWIAFPLLLTYLSRTGMLLTDVAFLGHYGSQYLAAASLASGIT
ncbi:hypothetical protein T484DRAFT_1784848 [Baffinella frigidus]|nr:hypothetical protein T484DRAFT_1784848 [Cryptophyta sp. CCMP2293]